MCSPSSKRQNQNVDGMGAKIISASVRAKRAKRYPNPTVKSQICVTPNDRTLGHTGVTQFLARAHFCMWISVIDRENGQIQFLKTVQNP